MLGSLYLGLASWQLSKAGMLPHVLELPPNTLLAADACVPPPLWQVGCV